MYYIYHIPGVKYGMTKHYPQRPASQSDVYELVETYEDIMVGSEREKQLNLEAGYTWCDTQYYYKMQGMGSRGGLSTLEKGTHNFQNGYGRKGWVSKEHQFTTSQLGGLAGKGRIQKKRVCPHCGKSGGNTMTRWHFDNCKSIR